MADEIWCRFSHSWLRRVTLAPNGHFVPVSKEIFFGWPNIYHPYRNLDLLGPLREAALSAVVATPVAALNLHVPGGHLQWKENRSICKNQALFSMMKKNIHLKVFCILPERVAWSKTCICTLHSPVDKGYHRFVCIQQEPASLGRPRAKKGGSSNTNPGRKY